MEGREEGILDNTQEINTENMPENKPGSQSVAAQNQQTETVSESRAVNESDDRTDDGRDGQPKGTQPNAPATGGQQRQRKSRKDKKREIKQQKKLKKQEKKKIALYSFHYFILIKASFRLRFGPCMQCRFPVFLRPVLPLLGDRFRQ